MSATYADGFRAVGTLTITGFDASAKARRSGEAILERTRAIFEKLGLGDYIATDLSVLGTEGAYGPHAQAHDLREAVMRLAVSHRRKEALEIFAREIAPAGTSWSAGTSGSLNAGRPNVSHIDRRRPASAGHRHTRTRANADWVHGRSRCIGFRGQSVRLVSI